MEESEVIREDGAKYLLDMSGWLYRGHHRSKPLILPAGDARIEQSSLFLAEELWTNDGCPGRKTQLL